MINETIEKLLALKVFGGLLITYVFAGVQASKIFESWGSSIIAVAGSLWGLYIAISKGRVYIQQLREKRKLERQKFLIEIEKKRIELEELKKK